MNGEVLAFQDGGPLAQKPIQKVGLVISSLASWALAETYIARGTPAQVLFGFLSFATAFVLALFVFAQLAELVRGTRYSYAGWFGGVAPAFTVLHLLLPAAILCRPFGLSGIFFYEIAKVAIVLRLLKLLSHEIRTITGWPVWGATLLAMSPVLLTGLGIALVMALLTAAMLVAMLALAL